MVDPNSSLPVNGKQRSNARKLCVCKNCGVTFKPKQPDRVSYCSRECAFESKAATPFTVIYAGYCKGCGKPFVSKTKSSYCCRKCIPRVDYVSTMPTSKVCVQCGKQFKPTSKTCPESYCSDGCRNEATHVQRRISKSMRKALIRRVTVERVDPFKVFDRDKWKCQLCGIKTPKAKRGTYDDNAPELDHIMPLSKGGEHSYMNTQCSCRKCNSVKSDTPLGQTLMFG